VDYANQGAVNNYAATFIGGNVGIGTTSPGVSLAVNGQIVTNNLPANPSGNTLCYSSSGYGIIGTCSSDERLKNTITPIATSSDATLKAVLNLNPVTFKWDGDASTTYAGFIAQDVMQQIPLAVRTNPDGYYTLDTTAILSYVVGAIQVLDGQISALTQEVAGFAQSFTSAIGNFGQVNTNELCVGSRCVTPAQFQAMVAAANASQAEGTSSAGGSAPPAASATSTPDTPPVIDINGDNPAIIQVGEAYTDLGATITGPQADLNLGIATFVNGAPMNPIQVDTSAAATDTVAYVVTDQNGLTATSTRTVIIETSPSVVPADDTPSTPPMGDASTTVTTSSVASSTASSTVDDNTSTTTSP
jgi:hypothetical protein